MTTATKPIESLMLSSAHIWPTEDLRDPQAAEEMAELMEDEGYGEFPAILVYVENGRYMVRDGHHRLEAARIAEIDVRATVVQEETWNALMEALPYGLEAVVVAHTIAGETSGAEAANEEWTLAMEETVRRFDI